jgi:hypothetical protein
MPDRWAASDVITADRIASTPRLLEVPLGIVLTHRSTGTTGEVVAFTEGARVILRDTSGKRHEFAPMDGFFEHDGLRVALRAAQPAATRPVSLTASGSVAPERGRAKVARASRIWVEGIHDAELLEKIWGDDLREERIVVEPVHGVDDLGAAIDYFAPGPERRLGVLLDHLVDGTKEQRIADSIDDPNVLITGHPYVDVWEAITPSVIGIESWPQVPRGMPWKEGIVSALGFRGHTGSFWSSVLGSVSSYLDLETPLVNAIEQLIDFVAAPDGRE